MAANSHQLPLSDVIAQYLDSRRDMDWPVSLIEAVKTIRLVSRSQHISDQQLGGLVAHLAIDKGRNVAFDMQTLRPPMDGNTRIG